MSDAVRTLLKNVVYLADDGPRSGFVFFDATGVRDVGTEYEPEYELAELVYDFGGGGVVVHGFSALVDIAEFVFRGFNDVDFSVFDRSELKMFAEVGLASAISSGITLPVVMTGLEDVVREVARQQGLKMIFISETMTEDEVPGSIVVNLIGETMFHDGKALGSVRDLICSPHNLSGKCLFLDLRGPLGPRGRLHAFAETGLGFTELYAELVKPYRYFSVDGGHVNKGSRSDLLLYDLRDPFKAAPLRALDDVLRALSRWPAPDLVFVGGDIFYEKGEHLAVIPSPKIHSILNKVTGREGPSVTASTSRELT
ncbi:MAG: hypothetical protein ABWK00_04680 [Desulfurococcaceae archaeon]